MSSDPSDRSIPPEAHAEETTPSDHGDLAGEKTVSGDGEQVAGPAEDANPTPDPPRPDEPSPEGPQTDAETPSEPRRRRQILIGSQRDVAAYRPKPLRDSIRIVGMDRRRKRARRDKPEADSESPVARRSTPRDEPATGPPEATREDVSTADSVEPAPQAPAENQGTTAVPTTEAATPQESAAGGPVAEPAPVEPAPVEPAPVEAAPGKRFPPPNVRDRLPADLEEEFQEALADVSLDELIDGDDAVTKQAVLEADSQHTGQVVTVRREDVFVELGGREQGILPLRQFDEPPDVGTEVKVRVVRFNPEEGLYELTRPGAAAAVGDWSDLEEGMIVEAKVTGHNTGGLECEVNHIRGFIPISQIALYRVEDLAQFVDEKLTCLVTEANPERRNLVLSHRAVLEREKEEARRNLLDSLEPGQTREGVVRKLVDFGAFVDLGGVDGLLHVSQLAWGRVNHPSEVLHEGQAIEVRIQSIDRASNRISLAYRDLLENPWNGVETKYPPSTPVHGKVTKLMEFGAFVELEPGVEGLVHISELSHKRVWRVSDMVNEGDEVDVLVLSVDAEAQRISLSMKGLIPEPKAAEKEEPSEPEEPAPPPKPRKKPSKPLRGGLGRSPGGGKFGLNW